MISKETPHLFMWFTYGPKLRPNECPLPQREGLNYVQRLKIECAKLQQTGTPVYLVYMGRFLNDEQKAHLEAVQHDCPNLAVIDYESIKDHVDVEIQKKVEQYAEEYQLQQEGGREKLDVGMGASQILLILPVWFCCIIVMC